MTAMQSPAQEQPGTGTKLRTGESYLRSLRDERRVYVDGERVADVTRHPAFARAAQSIANLFDIAAAPEMRERMTFPSPKTGAPVLRAYQIPRRHEELKARRLASETWAEATFGLMGRTPDHVAGFFCGYAAVPSVFAEAGRAFADNVVAFYEHLRDNHLYVSYAIVPPQIDRSKPAHLQSDPALYAGVVKERDDGIVLKGAQQLASAGLYADYIYISTIHPLQPGDENYAIGVAIPASAPGLKLYPRRPFAAVATNSFDYPLSGRFDEADCFVVLDDVFVPWEHVFIYRSIAICRDQWWKTPSHLYGNHQAQVRYATKLRFMAGLAKRMNEMTGNDANPAVQIQMGELAALVSIVENMLLAQETVATIDENNVLWPSRTALYCHGAAVGAERAHDRDHPRTDRRRHGHAAVFARRFRESGDTRRYRALHALRRGRGERACRRHAHGLGLHRLGTWQSTSTIRKILRRRLVSGEAERLPKF